MVDGLENRGPWGHTNTGTDEDSDFILEDVFGGSSVGTVDTERRHLLAVLQRNLVHAHGIQLIVKLGLRLPGAQGIGKCAGKVTDLTDVHRDVGVLRARSDGEWMPLVVADFWAVEEKPLTRLVLHAGLCELDLDSV